jgi:hypothetical protein
LTLKSSRKVRGFPNEAGSIGEKAARKWLENRGYTVYFFQDVMGMFAYLALTKLQMDRRRKEEYKENDRKLIFRIERLLRDIFGQSFEDLKRFNEAIRELVEKEETARVRQGVKKVRSIGFDFICKRNSRILFIEVKVNQAELKKYQKHLVEISKEYGFKAMVLRLDVEIEVSQIQSASQI